MRLVASAALAVGLATAGSAAAAPSDLEPVAGAPSPSGTVYKLTVEGQVIAKPCAGRVRLVYRVRGDVLATRFTRVKRSDGACRYTRSSKLVVPEGTRLPAPLVVRIQFLGNSKVPRPKAQVVRTTLKAR